MLAFLTEGCFNPVNYHGFIYHHLMKASTLEMFCFRIFRKWLQTVLDKTCWHCLFFPWKIKFGWNVKIIYFENITLIQSKKYTYHQIQWFYFDISKTKHLYLLVIKGCFVFKSTLLLVYKAQKLLLSLPFFLCNWVCMWVAQGRILPEFFSCMFAIIKMNWKIRIIRSVICTGKEQES